jgi:hypothetical protein
MCPSAGQRQDSIVGVEAFAQIRVVSWPISNL